jgi:hypothetical protein
MPIIMSVDHERKLVNAIAIGPVSFSDVENHLSMERQFGGLTYKELLDARGAGIGFTPTEIRQIVSLIRTLGQKSKLGPSAVLVSTDFAFGVTRLLEALLEDVCEIRPFWNEEEAKAWLATRQIES